jgi:DNA-binding PadR family transcriptional regulator
MPSKQWLDEHLPMKPLEFSVLLVLAEGALHGYGIVKRLAEGDAGGIRLAPSNLYHVLDRMITAGLVRETSSAGEGADAIRRRFFGITALGRAVVRAEAQRLQQALGTAARLRLLEAKP